MIAGGIGRRRTLLRVPASGADADEAEGKMAGGVRDLSLEGFEAPSQHVRLVRGALARPLSSFGHVDGRGKQRDDAEPDYPQHSLAPSAFP